MYEILFQHFKKLVGPDPARKIIYDVYCYDLEKIANRRIKGHTLKWDYGTFRHPRPFEFCISRCSDRIYRRIVHIYDNENDCRDRHCTLCNPKYTEIDRRCRFCRMYHLDKNPCRSHSVLFCDNRLSLREDKIYLGY